MTDDLPADISRVFDRNDAFDAKEEGYAVTTTVFDGLVTVDDSTDQPTYRVKIGVPTLPAATEDEVGPTVADSWLDTLERRLEDAPKATRARVKLDSLSVECEAETVHIEYAYTRSDPKTGADIAKTFVEYVEGTYVEGVVPGYDYVSPVADLLSNASQGDSTGTPL